MYTINDDAGRGGVLRDRQAVFHAGQAAHLCDFAIAFNSNLCEAAFAQLPNGSERLLARMAVELERRLDVIHCQARTQGDALGGDDVAQLFALRPLHFYVALRDEALEVPIDGAHGYAQLAGKVRLGDIRVFLNAREQIQLARCRECIFLVAHIFNA